MAEVLEDEGHEVEEAVDGVDAVVKLEARSFHLMFTDMRMPRMNGMELLKKVKTDRPEMEVIMLTAHGSVDGAVEAMKYGALDYLNKPLSGPAELRLVAARALERVNLKSAQERAEAQAPGEVVLTYGAPAMAPVVKALKRVAQTDATVLLVGESGTGKEEAARAVHRWSKRSAGPFVAINCAALSDSLLESELFGHEPGAFTGAQKRRRGRVELADGGTFFLDEIGELKLELQAKLLRVLQERRFERVGGNRTLEVDVRWVAATNRDLHEEMSKGRFREDLYHRLAVFPVQLPRLSERREDIVPIAESLLHRIGRDLGRPGLGLAPDGKQWLTDQPWPGNVRQLANALERAAILSDDLAINAECLALHPDAGKGGNTLVGRTLADIERMAVEETLRHCGGHRQKTAEMLGIGERTLYDKLKKYGLT